MRGRSIVTAKRAGLGRLDLQGLFSGSLELSFRDPVPLLRHLLFSQACPAFILADLFHAKTPMREYANVGNSGVFAHWRLRVKQVSGRRRRSEASEPLRA